MNDVQVWNNAAFDDTFIPMKTSWSSSECTKENLSPPALNSSAKPKKYSNTNKGFGSEYDNSSNRNRNIDDEIEEIEREITRLTTRLDALRIEKARRGRRVVGRAVPAKFMDPKPASRGVVSRKPLETPQTKLKSGRRGMSLGPAEIVAAAPASAFSRRKSCFWKLPEIDEESARAKTVGRVKKKEEGSIFQGKKLFEKEKVKWGCESNKKGLMKQGRVVASRYNSCDVRKRSLPEGGSEVRVKKRWEIQKNEEGVGTVMVLPKIKTVKCVNESPRDSGAAKRVAELVGKKPYFSTDEKHICQILNFAEEEGQ